MQHYENSFTNSSNSKRFQKIQYKLLVIPMSKSMFILKNRCLCETIKLN